jgi:hypothetical protein
MRQTQDSPLETPIDGLRATAAAPLPFAQNLRARSFLLEQQSSQADILPQLPGDGKKVSMICDVSKPEQVRALGAKVIEQFGRGAIYVGQQCRDAPDVDAGDRDARPVAASLRPGREVGSADDRS